MRAVIGKGVGSASRRGPAELAEAAEWTRGPICVGAGGGEENSKWKAEPGAWDPSRQSQASEPEQTTSDPVRAAAAPVWDLICGILEPVQQKTAKHAQPSPSTPIGTHSLPRTQLGASTPPHPPHHVVRKDLHSELVSLMSDPRPASGPCSSPG